MPEDPNVSPAPANPDPNAELTQRMTQLEQRYAASSEEGKRLKAQNDLLNMQVQQLQSTRPAIPQRTPYEQELDTLGIPLDALDRLVEDRATRVIEKVFQPINQHVQGQARARSHMLANYGKDFVRYEQDVAQNLQSDPELQQRYDNMLASDPIGAWEFAFLKFGEKRRREHPNGAEEAESDSTKSREQQAQAAVPTSRSGEARRADHSPQERVNRAWDAYQQNPNKHTREQYARARLATVVTDEHLYK